MAGTIPFSLTQQFDIYGQPLAGGKFYGIQAATVSTPQNFFQDFALTLPWPNPITLDAAGRIPQLYCADGVIKIRLTDVAGVTQVVADNITVIGPSSGGGGGGTVDPTTIYQTGDLKPRYGTGVHTGWVRANGLTIGSSTSGATEPGGNIAAVQPLFIYLWGVDLTLTVSGGRGASGLADWNANKQLTLPDWRGYALAALDDMGNTAAGRLSATYFGSSPIVLGAFGGGESVTLTAAQIPSITSGVNVTSVSVSGTISGSTAAVVSGTGSGSGAAVGVGWPQVSSVGVSGSCSATGTGSGSATSNNTSGNAHRTIGPRKLCTIYMKL